MVLDNRFKMLFVPHLKIQKRFEIESESNVVMRWAEGKKTHLITGLTPRYFFTLITPPFTFSKTNFKSESSITAGINYRQWNFQTLASTFFSSRCNATYIHVGDGGWRHNVDDNPLCFSLIIETTLYSPKWNFGRQQTNCVINFKSLTSRCHQHHRSHFKY